jgi:hypothetical protein
LRTKVTEGAHKKGGVVLSAYHATQGRRIVQTTIITLRRSAGFKLAGKKSRVFDASVRHAQASNTETVKQLRVVNGQNRRPALEEKGQNLSRVTRMMADQPDRLARKPCVHGKSEPYLPFPLSRVSGGAFFFDFPVTHG